METTQRLETASIAGTYIYRSNTCSEYAVTRLNWMLAACGLCVWKEGLLRLRSRRASTRSTGARVHQLARASSGAVRRSAGLHQARAELSRSEKREISVEPSAGADDTLQHASPDLSLSA